MKKYNVLVTGGTYGIGAAVCSKFLDMNDSKNSDIQFHVYNMDIAEPSNSDMNRLNYEYIQLNITDPYLPNIDGINILINNAGAQNSKSDIDVNLKGTINITNKYGIQPDIISIVNVASTSAHNGAEFPEYAASKGGMLAYTKAVAKEVAKFDATCNSISPGGVTTPLNRLVMDNPKKWDKIMKMTPLGKWADADEIAEFIYFMAVVNKSMTGQDIIVDNGEMINHEFVW